MATKVERIITETGIEKFRVAGTDTASGTVKELSILAGNYRVIRNDCRGSKQLVIENTLEIAVYVFFYLIKQHSKLLLHTLQVLYMCTLCDSTNINTIIEFVPNCL